jgi:hypothetical protein
MTVREGDELTMVYVADSEEAFVLRYTEEQVPEAFREIVRWANDSEIGFSWMDAARVARKIREYAEEEH